MSVPETLLNIRHNWNLKKAVRVWASAVKNSQTYRRAIFPSVFLKFILMNDYNYLRMFGFVKNLMFYHRFFLSTTD